ncbi:MAG TPA: hypothetical protein PLW02_06770 [Verrucomicrobiota bacterium]|nr:hypothetical protein [Verrucomicrobiota bacterium]
MRNNLQNNSAWLKKLSVFIALSYLTIFVAAHNQQIHSWLHNDANLPNHTCIITLLNNGNVDITDTNVAETIGLIILPVLQIPTDGEINSDYSFIQLTRGPPAA